MSRYALSFDRGGIVLTWNDGEALQGGGALTPVSGGELGSTALWEQIT